MNYESRLEQNKRSRQSPDHIDSRAKIIKICKTDNISGEISSESSKMDNRDIRLIDSFRSVLCEELDARFTTFSANEFIPLKNDVTLIKSEVESLKNELAEIRKEKNDLDKKVDNCNNQIAFMERGFREQNLIFYNVAKSTNVRQSIYDFCKQELKIETQITMNKVSVLKDDKTRNVLTVLVNFGSSEMSRIVLKSAKNLKHSNSGVSISRDLSEEDRKIKSLLLNIRKLIIQQGTSNNNKIKVFGNKFIFNDKVFTYNSRTKYFGNSEIDARVFLMENFSIDFDNFLSNIQ